jgi:uncharacterized membrane protein YkvI
MKKVFLTSMLITGTIIGAGFCSGKEIASYFAKYGFISLLCMPAMFLLYYFIFKIFLSYGKREKFDTFDDINLNVFGKLHKLSNIFVFIIYLIFTAAMFAGIFQIGQMFQSDLLSYLLIAIIFAFAYIMLLKPFNFLAKINSVLIPISVVLIITTCVKALTTFEHSSNSLFLMQNNFLLTFSPVIYTCQGLALAYFIMVKAGEEMSRKQIKQSALFSSVLLCILQILAIVLFSLNPELMNSPMPLVSAAIKIGMPYDFIYILTLFIAIVTTLLATSRGLHEIVTIKVKNKSTSGFVSLILALIFSLFGFDKIIEWFYPVIGAIGFVIFVLVLRKSFFVNFFNFANNKVHNSRKNT